MIPKYVPRVTIPNYVSEMHFFQATTVVSYGLHVFLRCSKRTNVISAMVASGLSPLLRFFLTVVIILKILSDFPKTEEKKIAQI